MKQKAQRPTEQGAALLLMLLILMGGVTTIFLYSWNTARQNNERDRITQLALQQAKAALLGRAVTSPSAPGRFPCPEQPGTTPEGQADGSCNSQAKRLGRLPWKTLDQEKLLDGYGEPLWYAISENFTAPPINSNTLPQLILDGASNPVVALIIAPGPPLPGQSRSPSGTGTSLKSADFLDLENATGNTFVSSGSSTVFNDKVIAISRSEVLQLLHKRVLAQVRGLDALTEGLKRYYNEHDEFPWPDSNGDGIADIGQVTGKLPSGALIFYHDTNEWLNNNNWFPLINYSRITGSSAQISLGSLSLNVLPCTAAPCP